jgi:hypothetical protein
MLLSTIGVQGRLVFDALPDRAQDIVSSVVATVALMSVWFLWRLWRFTALPWMHPDDPEELPYWIPSRLFKGTSFFFLIIY